jgi:uncharacterized protein (TIGR01244 family)
MADIRRVTEAFSVAPQISADDIADLPGLGFSALINNRPDGEAPDQLSSEEVRSLAEAAGLTYLHAPFVGQPTPEAVAAVRTFAQSQGATLAYCRSGTRSITAWALAEGVSGRLEAETIVGYAAGAGYDLSAMVAYLRGLRPRI